MAKGPALPSPFHTSAQKTSFTTGDSLGRAIGEFPLDRRVGRREDMMGKALPLRSDLSADALRAQARQEKKGRVVARMLAIAHALDGVGRAQAARLAGLDRQALRDTVIRYNAEGVAGLHDRRSPGRPPWLSLDERAILKRPFSHSQDLERDGCVDWTLPVLCEEVIAGPSRQDNSPGQPVAHRRVQLGLSRQKTRPQHPRSDAKAQEAFKKARALHQADGNRHLSSRQARRDLVPG